MSEVFSLIDGHPEEHVPAWEGEEAGSACGLTSEGSEKGSVTISYVDSLLREDCGGGRSPHAPDYEEGESSPMEVNRVRLSSKVPDVLLGSPERVGMRMESERFQSATDVLARHYGVSLLKGQSGTEAGDSEFVITGQSKKKMSYNFMEDEDEIKV